MNKQIHDIIDKTLDEMGVPSFAKSTVVTKAISIFAEQVNISIIPLDLGHLPMQLQDLIELTAIDLLLEFKNNPISHEITGKTFAFALLDYAEGAEMLHAAEEAKNAILM